MKHGSRVLPVLGLSLLLAGCSEYKPAPSLQPKALPQAQSQASPSASAARPPAEQPPPTPLPAQQLPTRQAPSAGPALQATPPPSPGPAGSGMAAARALPIRLSVGVALPQTGPEGTIIGFSADYQFAGGGPQTGIKYFWLIKGAGGKAARIPVRLEAQGNLARLLPWRPEDGPFQGHIEDSGGNRLSETIDLR